MEEECLNCIHGESFHDEAGCCTFEADGNYCQCIELLIKKKENPLIDKELDNI